MATVLPTAHSEGAVLRRTRLQKLRGNLKLWRGLTAMIIALILWEIGSRFDEWTEITLPFIGLIPPPTAVLRAWGEVLPDPQYWMSWVSSFKYVLVGFLFAQLIGIPLGLALAVNRYFREFFFRPSNFMSVAFVTFLGAFFTVVINVIGGARNIEISQLRAAQSMGASQWDLFWKVVLPGTLPSIFTGAAVGMGITWEVVVAAEMISGGGTQGGGGLGFFIWNSYMGGSLEQVVVGMISIGIAGAQGSSHEYARTGKSRN